MNVTPTSDLPPRAGRRRRRDREGAARQEVEGVFMTLLLKQGLQPSLDAAEEAGGGYDKAQEFAIEQTARDLGRQGAFGISDLLYAQLSQQL
jgi:Rod binding domain-containing protein